MPKKTSITAAPPLGDMDGEAFRKYGHQIIDWIADYLTHPEKYPVVARVSPGEIRAQLPKEPPQTSESMEAILDDFHQTILPGITHWNHPSFFAYFAITASGPGILGELLCSALNVNAMLWKTSPSATELEETVLDWLRQMLGLPPAFIGIIYDTASIAVLHALAAARQAVPGLNVREEGLAGRPDAPRLRLYISEHAHSSVEKAAIMLGIGQAGIRKIPVDGHFRMDPTHLVAAITEDVAAGWRPFCVVATVGTTSTTSIDPVPQIADLCEQHHLWLHVDAAYAGAAAIVPEMKHILAGCDRADSFNMNPHKWMFTPIDFSAFYCRRFDVLRDAFSLVPEYLRTPESASVRNYMDYGVQLGRRFRALKLWMIIRYFGQSGLAARLREHIRLAQAFANWVQADPDFELMAPVPFSTVCFRAHPIDLQAPLPTGLEAAERYLDHLNEQLMEAVNKSGHAYLSHTKLQGKLTLRLAIGNLRTQEAHVKQVWALLKEQAEKLHRLKEESF